MSELSHQTPEKVQYNLAVIQLASINFPAEWATPGSVFELDVCSRSRNFNKFGYNSYEDGLAISWTTKGFLEDRSHRLIIPRVGREPRYHRESFNVDIQAMGTDRVDVQSAEEIAALTVRKIPEAAISVELIASQAQQAAKIGWASMILFDTRSTYCR